MSNASLCPFAKAIQGCRSHCSKAESFHIAERHGIQCADLLAHSQCAAVSEQLHQHSRFALGVTQLPQQRTNSMELQIQCGGIQGIYETAPIEENNIFLLIKNAIEQYHGIEGLPYEKIIRHISGWKPPQRGKRR